MSILKFLTAVLALLSMAPFFIIGFCSNIIATGFNAGFEALDLVVELVKVKK